MKHVKYLVLMVSLAGCASRPVVVGVDQQDQTIDVLASAGCDDAVVRAKAETYCDAPVRLISTGNTYKFKCLYR
jgi:hypothetical protein